MRIIAQLNNLRIAPRKVRLVAELVKGKDAMATQAQLNFLTKRAAGPLAKLLRSALQNAEHNHGLLKDNLYIKEIVVNEGMKLKRYRPKAMGTVAPIQKKTSRVRMVLEEKVPGLKAKKAEPAEKRKAATAAPEAAETKKHFPAKTKPDFEIKPNINKKGVFGDIKNIGRKLFRRKSV